MKTIKFLSVLTAVAIVSVATAVEKPKMNVVPLSIDKAIVEITNENAALFELSITSGNGDLVYYKQSDEPLTDYKKIYDFTNLKSGEYVLTLKVNDTQLTKNFELNNLGIRVGDSKLSFDPYFSYKDNVLKLSYLNFEGKNVYISFYNDGSLIFKRNLGKNFAITSGYNLSKLEPGNYKVVLSSNYGEYPFSIVK